MNLAAAAILSSLLLQAAAAPAQDDRPSIIYMGPHPFPSVIWSASYVHHCMDRDVGFSVDVDRDRIRVTELDLGAASTAANLDEVNSSLARLMFTHVGVSCTPGGPTQIQFSGLADTGGPEYVSASVSIFSQSPSSQKLMIEKSAAMLEAKPPEWSPDLEPHQGSSLQPRS